MRKLFFILAVSFALPSIVNAQNSPAQMMIMGKMLSLRNSLLSKDSVALSDLLADDVTYGHTNGLVQTKAQLIRSVVSGEQDYKSIDPAGMNIRMYDNVAVVNMQSKVSMIYQGKSLDMDIKTVLTWIKIKDQWKLVARQSVKL